MWVPLKLDVGWSDVAFGVRKCLHCGSPEDLQQRLENEWSQGRGYSLASLSLRTSFDLLLTALKLPQGSELLFSAITIPDMPLIAEQHGLRPIAVSVLGPDCRVDTQAMLAQITVQTRMIVVAQLFGYRTDLSRIREILGSRDILLVEDCAQAWFRPGWRGSSEADVSLFSFGTIKTATAFGGGLARLTSPDLLRTMGSIQAGYPRQRRRDHLLKVLKGACLKGLSSRGAMSMLLFVADLLRLDFNSLLSSATRGFHGGNLLVQLRRQPSAPLLELMARRIKTDPGSRISRRMENADRIRSHLGECGLLSEVPDSETSDWLLPVFTDYPEDLIEVLRKHGFDAARRGRLHVIPAFTAEGEEDLRQTRELLDRMVFLPCYSEMPLQEIDRMCEVIRIWCSTTNSLEKQNLLAT